MRCDQAIRSTQRKCIHAKGIARYLIGMLVMLFCLLPVWAKESRAAEVTVQLGQYDAVIGLYQVGDLNGTTLTPKEAYAGVGELNALFEHPDNEDQQYDARYAAAASAMQELLLTGEMRKADGWTRLTFTADGSDSQTVTLGTGVYFGALLERAVLPKLKVSPFFALVYGNSVKVSPKCELVTAAQVIKSWDDADNQDGGRTDSIYVGLYARARGSEAQGTLFTRDGFTNPVLLSKENNQDENGNWVYRADDLPYYTADSTDAQVAEYVWREVAVTTGEDGSVSSVTPISDQGISYSVGTGEAAHTVDYTVTYQDTGDTEAGSVDDPTGNASNVNETTITNTHTPETKKLAIVKAWDDAANQAATGPDAKKRPAEITVHLLKNGAEFRTVILKESDDPAWTYTTEALPVYEEGKEIVYSWSEDPITEYAMEPIPAPVTTTGTDGVVTETTTITNTYQPEYTSASFQKIWSDANDQDGRRPETLPVTLLQNGSDYRTFELTAPESGGNAWTSTTPIDLPRYDKDHKEIIYTWREETTGQTFAQYYTASAPTVTGTTTTITNTHTPETVNMEIHKIWQGDESDPSTRPASVTMSLWGASSETPVATRQLTAENDWTVTISDLPKYQNGKEIAYTWTEDGTIDGYEKLTPVKDPETLNAPTVVTNVTNRYVVPVRVSVTKIWMDEENFDGSRPDSISVQLYANGNAQGAPVSVTEGEDGTWTYVWPSLPRLNENGDEIVYTVAEVDIPDGYAMTGTTGTVRSGFFITNTHTPVKGSLRIVKEVTINGASTTRTAVDGTYQFRITGPNDFERIVRIDITGGASDATDPITGLRLGTYTVSEITDNLPASVSPVGTNTRTVEVTADGDGEIATVTFVNNMTEETEPPTEPNLDGDNISIPITKVWVDESNAHNSRPASITVRLYANGTLRQTQTIPAPEQASDTWTYTFEGLPRNDASGVAIVYTVEEEGVTGYTTTVEGTTITNTLIPETPKEYTNLSGVKRWADNGNAEGTRPSFITVHLMRDGNTIVSRTVTAANGWSYTFENVPVDDGYGNQYEYTVREEGAPGYFLRTDGINMTNALLPTEGGNRGGNPPGGGRTTPPPPFSEKTEEELEEVTDLFDYDTPLWGGLLGTGDRMPVYPFIFGGIGVAAVLILVIFGRKKKKEEKAG